MSTHRLGFSKVGIMIPRNESDLLGKLIAHFENDCSHFNYYVMSSRQCHSKVFTCSTGEIYMKVFPLENTMNLQILHERNSKNDVWKLKRVGKAVVLKVLGINEYTISNLPTF